MFRLSRKLLPSYPHERRRNPSVFSLPRISRSNMSADAAGDQAEPSKSEQPANLTNEVRAISRHPVGFGGFSDIYTGIWESAEGEKKVALKVLRVRAMDAASKKMLRQLLREISVWKRLSHPNIHALYGLYDGIGPAPAMVSPWCKNGDINNYIAGREDDPQIDGLKLKLFVGVMAGLRFLHDNFIIHGDIKGGNVLISDEGVPQLCDFGLSRLLWGSTQSISNTGGKGTLRWMAPELLVYGEVHSYKSDIWAAGCLLVEIWTGQSPYPPSYNDQQILLGLSQRRGPPRPNGMPDFTSSILRACCNFDRHVRPAPVELMARVSIQLVMPRISKQVTRMRSPERFDADLLHNIENSLQAADAHQTAELHSLNEHELAVETIRVLSLWSLGITPGLRLYKDTLYMWSLDIVVHRSQPLPLIDTAVTRGRKNEDEDEEHENEDSRIYPPKLRPFARLVAAIDPTYADVAMLRFARASVGSQIRFKQHGSPRSCVWFPDGNRMAVGLDNGALEILSTSSGATIHRLNGHTSDVFQVAISPNGTQLASCSRDLAVRLWDAVTGNAIGEPMLGHTFDVLSVAFSPDGGEIASGSFDGTIRIWSCDTGATVIGPLHVRAGVVCSVMFSVDGTRIVSGSGDKTIRFLDAQTGACQCVLGPLYGHEYPIVSIAFSPDESSFVSCSWDNTARIWDASSGEPVGVPMEGHRSAVTSVAYSPDSARIASGSDDCTILIWDAATGAPYHQPFRGHKDSVRSVAFSPDGRKLASASGDGSVRIWDATDEWTRWDI